MNLKSSPIFQGLTQEMLDEIQHHTKLRCYQPNEFICRQGEIGSSIFIIQSGLVEIFMRKSDSIILLDRLRHGDMLGEIALITGEPLTASAVAITITKALELSRNYFAIIVAYHPGAIFKFSSKVKISPLYQSS